MADNITPGNVYVAGMNMRGARAATPDNCIKVNATSAQQTLSKNRRDFSPMTEIKGGYKGFWNFESYWQSGKVFADVPHEKSLAWWKANKKPKRRYPGATGKTVLHAKFPHIEEELDWVASRKRVYVIEYYELVKDREMALHWKKMRENGRDIVVYDFDGPRDDNGSPICIEVDVDILKEKINNTTHVFGHGYVVAAIIKGITPDEYVI